MDLLDAPVEVDGRGRVAGAEALGVNYRTVARCQQSRLESRRMRQVLQEFRDSQDAGDDELGVVAVDGAGEDTEETLELRAAALEQENRELRETVQAQAGQLGALRRQVAELEEPAPQPSGAAVVDGDLEPPGDWRPPRRGPGLPDACVVKMDEQPDEDHALGPAAPLVAEWRRIRARMGDGSAGRRVDRAEAAMRRWGDGGGDAAGVPIDPAAGDGAFG